MDAEPPLPPGVTAGPPIALKPREPTPMTLTGADEPPLPPGVTAGPPISLNPPGFVQKLERSLTPTPTERKMLGDVGEYYKSQALGMGEAVTGLGELIPGVHPYAAEASKWLHEHAKSPIGEGLGYLAPFALGGELTGGAKLASAIPELGEGLAARLGTKVVRGGVSGAVAGAEAGAATPTGEKDYKKSMEKKGREAGIGAGAGLALGGALGAGGQIAREGKKVVDLTRGTEAKAAAEKLREELSGRVAGAATEEEAKAQEALKKAAEIETKLGEQRSKLDIASSRAADLEEQTNALIDAVRNQPTMDAKAFGQKVRDLAERTHKKYRDIRAQESGYTAALAETTDEPVVNTQPIRDFLNEWEKRTASGSEKSIISYLRDEIGTKEGTGESAIDAINTRRADSLRKVLDDLSRTKDLKVIGKGDGSAATAAYEIGRVRVMLKKAIEEADPRLAEATQKFRKLSRPLDFLERKGPLAGALRKDALSGEYQMERAKLVENLLTKTKAGSSAFARLISEDPELKDDARQYFRHRLFGETGFEKKASPETIQKFVTDNKDALEQTGLLDEFSGLAKKATTLSEGVSQMSAEAAIRQGNVSAMEKSLKEAESAGRVSADAKVVYDDLARELRSENVDLGKVADKTKKAAVQLMKDEKISPEEYQKLREQIDTVTKNVQDHDRLWKYMKRLGVGVAFAAGGYKLGHFIWDLVP